MCIMCKLRLYMCVYHVWVKAIHAYVYHVYVNESIMILLPLFLCLFFFFLTFLLFSAITRHSIVLFVMKRVNLKSICSVVNLLYICHLIFNMVTLFLLSCCTFKIHTGHNWISVRTFSFDLYSARFSFLHLKYFLA